MNHANRFPLLPVASVWGSRVRWFAAMYIDGNIARYCRTHGNLEPDAQCIDARLPRRKRLPANSLTYQTRACPVPPVY